MIEFANELEIGKMPLYQGHHIHFNMRSFFDDQDGESFCNTQCCIAGALVFRYGTSEQTDRAMCRSQWETVAADILSIGWGTANMLFMPSTNIIQDAARDNQWASRVLRKLAETGIVDWEGTRSHE